MSTIHIKLNTHHSSSNSIYKKLSIRNPEMNVVHSEWFHGNETTATIPDQGLHCLEVTLPSGKSFQDTIILESNKIHFTEFDISTESPHEYMEWAYFSKRLPKRKDFSRDMQTIELEVLHNWNNIARAEYLSDAALEKTINLTEDGEVFTITTKIGRAFLLISGVNIPAKLVALPAKSNVKCLIRNSKAPAEYVHPIEVYVSTENSQAEIILQMMSKGAIREAKVLIEYGDVAEELLFNKTKDPTNAAVGGYFLLKIGDLERLHNWPQNLANWFSWLPDGCIIQAWQLLKQAKEKKIPVDINQVFDWLANGLLSGIPIYSEGFRLLYDGLRLINYNNLALTEENRFRLNSALNLVEYYTTIMDLSNPVVTLTRIPDIKPQSFPAMEFIPKASLRNVKNQEKKIDFSNTGIKEDIRALKKMLITKRKSSQS